MLPEDPNLAKRILEKAFKIFSDAVADDEDGSDEGGTVVKLVR
jgi:hypothetical protein